MDVDEQNPNPAGDAPAGDDTANAANPDSAKATDADAGKGQGDAGNGGDAPADPNPKAGDKPDDGEGEGGKDGDDDKEDDEPQGAPEQYEQFELPEGFALEGERLEMAHEFAKANNWTQQQAQEGVNSYLKFRAAELEHERGMWGAQSEEEFGKDFATISTGARTALVEAEKHRPGITDRLDATNLGNHPDVLWMCNQLGVLASARPMHGIDNDNAAPAEPDEASRWNAFAEKPVNPRTTPKKS